MYGTTGWTKVTVLMNSGAVTELTVTARLGFWAGVTKGTAWYDDLSLVRVRPSSPSPPWRILTLIYSKTDLQFTDTQGVTHHVVGTMTQAQKDAAAAAARAFVTQDIPALDSRAMVPTITVRFPARTLTQLDPSGGGVWPSPANTAPELDPAFDSVIVIWIPDVVDQDTGEAMWIGSAAGLTPDMGTGQTYVSMIIDAATSYGHRNVFKHEFGHSITAFFQAAGTAPTPTVNNHTDATTYVHCPTGAAYVWVDETQANPVPNSIYNNASGFTHDYYSGTTALAATPTSCLGVTPYAWSMGGPVSG